MKQFALIFVVALGLGLFAGDVKSAEPATLVGGLDNPTGVVAQPGSGHVFVATRTGVWRVDPETKKATAEITGYPEPTDIYGKGPKYPIGPLGLAFIGNNRLVVGDGSRKDGAELMRVYRVGQKARSKPLAEDKALATLGPITPGEASKMGEGNFYGVAVGGGAIFVTCNGDDTKGWISKATFKGNEFGVLTPTIATKVATGVDAPVGITMHKGKLVVSQMGEMNVPNDSLLTFYNPKTGKLISKHKTNLHDIAGVAYSPKTGKLYAVDFGWIKNEDGGLFELQMNGDEVSAKKIASLDKPTALAFDKNGNLFVTVFGAVKEGAKEKTGSVVVFKGL